MTAQDTIGQLLSSVSLRDAVHVSVMSVVAQVNLVPGDHVGIDGTRNNPVGIVDPFLQKRLNPGDVFWLFVYPRKVTSLRHVWSHPDIPDEFSLQSSEVKVVSKEKEIALYNLKTYAEEVDVDLDVLLSAAEEYLESGSYLNLGGKLEGLYVDDRFWDNYGVYTDKHVKSQDRGNFFTCSC